MVGKLKKVIIATSLFAVLLNAEGTSEEGGASTSATSEKVTVREEKSSPKFEVKREEIHSKKKESGSSKIHEKQKKSIKKSENYSSKSHKSTVKNENIENNEVENNEIIIRLKKLASALKAFNVIESIEFEWNIVVYRKYLLPASHLYG